MIKVAMILRSTAQTVKGGDIVQAMQTADHLADLGVTADIKMTDELIDYSRYHLLHFFNITRPADILFHLKKTSLPFVLSPIFVDYSEYDNQRKGLSGFIFRGLSADKAEFAKTIARRITGTDKLMSNRYFFIGQKRSIEMILQKTALLLPNSISEYERLKKAYHFDSAYSVIPNGVSPVIFKTCINENKDPLLVICAARIEGIKNQLMLIRALNNTAYRLILIGDPAPNQHSYYNACKKEAAANISFRSHISQRELFSYYQKAGIHALPSLFETTGLSSLEAAAHGCNIVITDRGDQKAYFGNDAVYCDPSSPENIFAAVEKAAEKKSNDSFRKKIAESYTWHSAAEKTAAAYHQILSRR